MGKLISFIVALCIASTAFSYTVTGPVVGAGGSANSTIIKFTPKSTPFFSGTNLVIGQAKSVQVRGGTFSTTLQEGRYEVSYPPIEESFTIYVPTGDGTNTLAALQTNVFQVVQSSSLVSASGLITNYAGTGTNLVVKAAGAASAKALSVFDYAGALQFYVTDEGLWATNLSPFSFTDANIVGVGPDGNIVKLSGTLTNNTTGNAAGASNIYGAAITTTASIAATNGARFNLSSYLQSDTDLTLGLTNTGANASATVQRLLDMATNGPILINWDVAISVSGLRVRSNTRIDVAAGAGARLLPAANTAILNNYNYSYATNQPGWLTNADYSQIACDTNITINGGIWDGNAPWQSHDTAADGWVSALRFMNVRNLTLNDVSVYQPRTFSVHFANWENVTVRNFYGNCVNTNAVNRDGLHFNGPGRNLIVDNVKAMLNDDVVAISPNDIDQQGDGSTPVLSPFANSGDIYDVQVSNVQLLAGGLRGIRLLSSTNVLDNVVIKNVIGSYGAHVVVCDNYSENPTYMRGLGAGKFGRITIDGVNVKSYASSAVTVSWFFFGGDITNLTLRNIQLDLPEAGNVSPVRFIDRGANNSCVVGDVTIENLTVLGPTNESSFPLYHYILVDQGVNVRNMSVKNFKAVRRSSITNPLGSVVACSSSSTFITNLTVSGVNAPHLLNNIEITSRPQTNIVNWTVSDSNIPIVLRGNSADLSTTKPNPEIPGAWTMTAPVNNSRDGIFGGLQYWRTNGTFSAIIKMPDAWSGGNNLAIGMRCLGINNSAISRDGYLLVVNTSAVTLYKSTSGGSLTSLGSHTISLTAGAEYRLEIECQGTTINARVQRISDEQWLGSGGTFAAGRTVALTATDSTYLHGNSWISNYAGTSTDKTIGFRDLRYY